jgi:transposase
MIRTLSSGLAVEDQAAQSFLVSDALWSKIQPLLPVHKNTHRFGGGRPRRPDRDCLNGIFFVLRTGCQWKALSATGICPCSTAHDRFQEWVKAGVFLRFWETGLLDYDELKGINWAWLSMDGCMTKAPLGGKKMWRQSHGSGQAGRQTLGSGRWRRPAFGPGRRGRQQAGLPTRQRDAGKPADPAAQAYATPAPAHVPGQGL